MPIPKAAKIAAGLVSSGGAIGGGIYGYTVLNITTIKDHLKDTLIKESETKIWEARVPKLGAAKDTELSEELKKIKAGTNGAEEIKAWCFKNIESKFSSEDDSLFKNINLLCTYDIKDKIKVVAEEAWAASKNDDKLKAEDPTKLSATMKGIKVKLQKTQQPESNALKDWCKATYDKQFKGETDQEYLDAKVYCQAQE